MLTAIWTSTLLVLACEMGDKTQLLALILAARFRSPWVVLSGILVATIANHALAAWVGGFAANLLPAEQLSRLLAVVFFAFAVWVLIPDKADDGVAENSKLGAFATTVVAFFLAEMGDKTQLATVALGARYSAPIAVTVGTTMGMLIADGLAVFCADRVLKRLSMKWIRRGAAFLFVVFGLLMLVPQN